MLPYPGQKVYNATKTALTFLTEGLRHELAHAGLKIKATVSVGRKIKSNFGIFLFTRDREIIINLCTFCLEPQCR